MTPIEKAKDIIAKGEKAISGPWIIDPVDVTDRLIITDEQAGYVAEVNGVDDNPDAASNAAYIVAANPADLLPVLRLLVECEEGLEALARVNCSTSSICAHMRRVARALLDKLRSES